MILANKAENPNEHPFNVLPYAVICYNNTKNKTHAFTPYELIFGHTSSRPPQTVYNQKTLITKNPDILSYPIDSDAVCEAQLLKQVGQLPRACQTLLLFAKDYSVQEVDLNLWLITISDPLPVTMKCANKDIVSKLIDTNSLLKLQPECSAFIGTTRVQSKYQVDNHPSITYKNHPVTIPFECCNHLPEKLQVPDLQPLKLKKIDTEDLNIAQHKLNQYSDELDKLINEPFITKRIPWVTILTIILVICLIVLYVFCKCRRRRTPKIIVSTPNDHQPSPPPMPTTRIKWTELLPKRRPSIRPQEPLEDQQFELQPKVVA
ncbi:hypothetical protein NQ318_007594 [Aromia moschata]|uniref:Envelope protein n=1 Tax=Aromia moschata TaxID=1265417 RepID=A0AAV8YCM1_9CUCU|nr:hypothetical protein NQ318_007594 [Aromia moschata]